MLANIMMRVGFYRNYLLRKMIDEECDSLIEKVFELEDRFLRSFFTQIINCTKLETYEFFCYIMKECSSGFTKQGVMEAIKWISLYKILKFSTKKDRRSDINRQEIPNIARNIFALSEKDAERFDMFTASHIEDGKIFESEFNVFFIFVICEIKNNTPMMLAFVSDFFYNLYEDFIKSFTNYVSVNSKFYENKAVMK